MSHLGTRPPIAPAGPCACYRKVADNVTHHADGRITCHLCGHTWDSRAWTAHTLQTLLEQLQAQHPDLTFVLDEDVVWLRHAGHDYGVYTRTILGQVVLVMQNGSTVVHRNTPS